MRFVVEQPVFADPATDTLALLAFFDACRDVRRHVVLTDPRYRRETESPVNLWIRGQSPRIQERVTDLLERSVVQDTQNGPKLAARVVRGTVSHWEKTAGRGRSLSVRDAARIAGAPLKLLVENRRSDGAFLRRLLGVGPEAERRMLEVAFDAGWLEIENGGGLEDLRAWVRHLAESEEQRAVVWIARLRLWALFDRDAHPTDRTKPSDSSEETCGALAGLGARCGEAPPMHRLARRAIENYLPAQSLVHWAKEHKGVDKTALRTAAEAFVGPEMNDTMGADRLRNTFNMKEGLIRDAPNWKKVRREVDGTPRALRDDELDPIYRRLTVQARLALADGFGGDVGKVCFPNRTLVQDDWLEAEVEREEREAIVRGIFERL